MNQERLNTLAFVDPKPQIRKTRWAYHASVLALTLAAGLAIPLVNGTAFAKSEEIELASAMTSQYDGRTAATAQRTGPVRDISAADRSSENWFTGLFDMSLGWVRGLVDGRQVQVGVDFSKFEYYEQLHLEAAGWNGDAYSQFQLGRLFGGKATEQQKKNPSFVQTNYVISYYWYSLAAAQDMSLARRARRDLVLRNNMNREQLTAAYLRFVETYVFGGPDSLFALGELLDHRSKFFRTEYHNQDLIDPSTNFDNSQLIFAYAAYELAAVTWRRQLPDNPELRSNLLLAERNRDAVRNYIGWTDDHIQLRKARRTVHNWGKATGLIPDHEDPFKYTENVIAESLKRGAAIQDRRGGEYQPPDRTDEARSWLLRGRSAQVTGNVKQAKVAFENTIRMAPESEAALEAQQALMQLTTTCSAVGRYRRSQYNIAVSNTALAGRTVDFDRSEQIRHGLAKVTQKVPIGAQQQALKSLGYYEGYVDGKLGPETRQAVRKFLASINDDKRDFLDPEQIVELICQAAQLRQHSPSQNMLGVMYVNGIGVRPDIDLALYYFSLAANQGDPSAIFNTGRLYEAGRVLAEYTDRQNREIAIGLYKEAAEKGHPDARRALVRLRVYD